MAGEEFKDEESYRDYLIKNGLDPAIAAQVAAKTAGHPPPSPPILVAPGLPEKEVESRAAKKAAPKPEVIDFRGPAPTPGWVREVIEAHLAIETEDAAKAGALGFMARALVIATMPYKDQKNPDGSPKESFTRQNGDFRLRIVAGYEGGIPFGIYPRLLMSWVTTEAVRKQSPVVELGDSLRTFLRDVLDLRASGGSRGTATRVSEQMRRLFGSLITAQYSGGQDKKGFILKNILIADELVDNDLGLDLGAPPDENALWTPQKHHEAGSWQSKVRLTHNFFEELVNSPVPIDLRAFKALRGSPLAMDIYTWLSYRMSYTQKATRPISWEGLMMQFGTGFGASAASETGIKQAVLDFKKGFLKALKLVLVVYPAANVVVEDNGLVLLPSKTHIPQVASKQAKLF